MSAFPAEMKEMEVVDTSLEVLEIVIYLILIDQFDHNVLSFVWGEGDEITHNVKTIFIGLYR